VAYYYSGWESVKIYDSPVFTVKPAYLYTYVYTCRVAKKLNALGLIFGIIWLYGLV
jgi:hypothetical protein